MWQYAKHYVNTVDFYAYALLEQFKMIDKVRVAMFVTWLWALFGLYTAKAFESFFSMLLKMPDSCLSNSYAPDGIKILHASDGTRDITNKFRLFLKYCWEKDEQGDGFSFAKLQRLLNCSMLYCSYLLTDKNGTVNPDKFWQNVNRFLVELQDNTVVQRDSPDAEPQEVPFGQVQFRKKKNIRAANNEMRDSLLAILEPNTVQRIARQFDQSE